MNYNFHEIFLSDNIFTADNLLQDVRQYSRPVEIEIDALELTEVYEVGANKNTKVLALQLPLFSVA